MNVFAEIVKKPWLPEPEGELEDGPVFPIARATLGFRFFLGIVVFLFTLMVGAYADRIVLNDWRPMPELPALWLNTLLLVLASLAMRGATQRLAEGPPAAKKYLVMAAALSIAFVAGQLAAWRELVELGYFAAANPANAFFYMITGVHGVHVLGGLAVLLNAIVKLWSSTDAAGGGLRLAATLRLCAVYWHFLLIVWLVLFALFLFT